MLNSSFGFGFSGGTGLLISPFPLDCFFEPGCHRLGFLRDSLAGKKDRSDGQQGSHHQSAGQESRPPAQLTGRLGLLFSALVLSFCQLLGCFQLPLAAGFLFSFSLLGGRATEIKKRLFILRQSQVGNSSPTGEKVESRCP